MNLQSWLRRQPQPTYVMCGDQKISIGTGRRRWADAITSIFSYESAQVVAMDQKGSVLRVVQREEIDDQPEAETPAADVTDNQKDMAQVAQVFAEAYATAHEQARETSSRGYELLAKFAELSFQRLSAIEKAYGQLLSAHARMVEAQAGETGDGLESAIGDMIMGKMGITAPTRPNGQKPATEPKKDPT